MTDSKSKKSIAGEGAAETVRLRRTRIAAPAPLPLGEDERALLEALLSTVATRPDSRFHERAEIGRGGAGAVNVVFDEVLQRRTAMKKLLEPVRGQPMMVRAFVREAQITAQLDHPNLVPVHAIGMDENGRIFFTMKLVEGQTLAQLIENNKDANNDPAQAFERMIDMLDVLMKVCDALAFAHSRGVIHCDLKAENIMCGSYGQTYLMDWGIAQLLPPPADGDAAAQRWVKDPLPQLPDAAMGGYIFGTPGYMAPEQALGHTGKLDARTDVFSLGALLYQILTGNLPYAAATAAETVLLAQRCEFPPISTETAGLYSLRPKELVRISAKAMSRNPADRYPSVDEFKADMVRYLRGGSHFPTRIVFPGETIIAEGADADAAFIIASGQCEVYKTAGGRKLSLHMLQPGEVFGEMALLTDTKRSASVVALTEVHLMVITRDAMDQEMHSMKPWMGALVRSLAARFRKYQDRSIDAATL